MIDDARRLLAGVLAFALTSAAAADLLFVPGEYATIQLAVDAATAGDEVVVLPGTYAENVIVSGDVPLTIRSLDPQDDDVVLTTVIDGHDAGTVLTVGSGATIVVEGLTVTGGTSTTGGGLLLDGADVTVRRCVIVDNAAEQGGGASVCCGGSVSFEWCGFESNRADPHGAAVHAVGAIVAFTDCRFLGNSAVGQAGIIAATESEVEMAGCRAEGNSGKFGGAFTLDASSLELRDSSFVGTTARTDGGVFYLRSASAVAITRSQIAAGWTRRFGGVAYIDGGSSWSITDSLVSSNRAGDDGEGTPLYIVDGSAEGGTTSWCAQGMSPLPDAYVDLGGTTVQDEPCAFDYADVGDLVVCCLGGSCVLSTRGSCETAGGVLLVAGSSCDDCAMQCPGDIDGDGIVGVSDLLVVLSAWGTCP